MNHVAELITEMRELPEAELVGAFINRERDNDFALIGEMVVARNAPRHVMVFSGYDHFRGNRYAGE